MRFRLIYVALFIQGTVIAFLIVLNNLLHRLEQYLDIEFMKWLFWVCLPFILIFLLPLLILIFIYGCIVFIRIYQWRHRIQEDLKHNDPWEALRVMVASFWDTTGWIWHGYEVEGLENIPESGPGIIIYYHATLPMDMVYLHAKLILLKHRSLQLVADRFLFTIPGWKHILELFRIIPGTYESCAQLLEKDALLSISPGGVREAQFGSEHYELIWGTRSGFAKVALACKVPVIPMFTENCRESFRTPGFLRRWLKPYYERWRIPFVPIYGGFPVKMRTHLGSPIYPKSNETFDELRQRIHDSVERLIEEKQPRIPGVIFQATLDRFRRKTTIPEPESSEEQRLRVPAGADAQDADATTDVTDVDTRSNSSAGTTPSVCDDVD